MTPQEAMRRRHDWHKDVKQAAYEYAAWAGWMRKYRDSQCESFLLAARAALECACATARAIRSRGCYRWDKPTWWPQ